jgi:hypothetical protein
MKILESSLYSIVFGRLNYKKLITEESIMFNNNNATNEVAELLSEFQSRIDEIKSKYNIVDLMPQPEHQAIQEPVIELQKTFIINIDPQMGLSDEEFENSMKGFAMAKEQKPANANS